jgi:hypothetical protein
MKQSAVQIPVPSQTRPPPQLEPMGWSLNVVVEMAGLQTWHGLRTFIVPDGNVALPMMQSSAHVPLLQTSPVPHGVPSASLVQAVLDVAGTQVWHAFAGFAAPAA